MSVRALARVLDSTQGTTIRFSSTENGIGRLPERASLGACVPSGRLLHTADRKEEAAMAGKLAEQTRGEIHDSELLFEAIAPRPTTEVRPLRVALSGTVVVDFDVTVTEGDGAARHALVRVEFPDEVRSMLEASTWTRGTSIYEAVSRLGASFLERNHVGDLVCGVAPDGAALRPATFHLPLSFVRSSLAAVCASIT
jgi:hypothetical protein